MSSNGAAGPGRQCIGTVRSGPRKGERCTRTAMRGSTCCHVHLRSPQARANAAVRAEVEDWTVGDIADDPGETLLRLVTQSRRRADRLARELHTVVDAFGGSLQTAMVGDTYTVDGDGNPIKVGEYIRGLAQLESQERDRCANFATKAVAAGLAERQVRLAERQGELINELLVRVLDELGLPEDQIDRVPDLIERHLELVAG